MRWIDIFRIALRMLRTNFLRSVLTILGIGVAISLIVVLIGLGYGLQTITIGSIVESKALLSVDITAGSEEGSPLTPKTEEEIRVLAGAEAISPVILTSGQAQLKNKLISMAVTAAYPSYLEMDGIGLRAGKVYEDNSDEVVLTPQVLELAEIRQEDILGQTITLTYSNPNNEAESKTIPNLKVVGIVDLANSPAVFMPYQKMNPDGQTKISLVKVVAASRDAVISIRDVATVKGYQVETLVETLDQAIVIFRWVTIGLGIFGFIALIVASIGMFNTLTIALIERTREIGIMKAIGVNDKTVQRLFLAEAGSIGFLGGLSGIGIGISLNGLMELILHQAAKVYEGSQLALFQYPDGFLISMVIFPIFLAMVTGLYPAVRAARLNPLKALRYE